MIVGQQVYQIKGISYTIRSAAVRDAAALSALRVQIDGETEYLDREPGEAFIDPAGFEQLIQTDAESPTNLFLVAEADGTIVGFSRCEGNTLRRFAHKAEFGICIAKEFWGFGIGGNLLKETVSWADSNRISKLNLHVLESNEKAISLYKKFGFEVEGVLKNDKILADGRYHNTVIMGRVKASHHL